MAAFGSAFGSRTTAAPTAAAAHPHNPNNDMEVVTPQDDSISSLNFSPKSNHLVATSWDNQARPLAGPRPLLHTGAAASVRAGRIHVVRSGVLPGRLTPDFVGDRAVGSLCGSLLQANANDMLFISNDGTFAAQVDAAASTI